ncbi:MAG: hypothetical protein Q4D06_01235 [Coriobacteriia bacterium]|nr:hypothetical protein [Coriobacteriia bacterium]
MAIILSHSSALAWWRNFTGNPDDLPVADVRRALNRSEADRSVVASLDRQGLPRPFQVLVESRGSKLRSSTFWGHSTDKPLSGLIRQTDLPQVFVVCPELCLMQNATGLDFAQLIELVCEFLGEYRIISEDETRYDQPRLCSKESIAYVLPLAKGIHGSNRIRAVLKHAEEGSASPQETRSFLKLSLPNSRGGLSVSRILMNHPIPLDRKNAKLLGKDHCRIDLYLPDLNRGIEYDSYQEHLGKARHDDDAMRRTVLESLGIPVSVLTHAQTQSPELMEALVKSLYHGTGRVLRIRCKGFREKQDKLWKQLDGKKPQRLSAEEESSDELQVPLEVYDTWAP